MLVIKRKQTSRNTENAIFDILKELDYGVILLDDKGGIKSVNETASDILNVDSHKLIGKPYIFLGEGFFSVADQALNAGALMKNTRVGYKCTSGDTRYLFCSAYTVKNALQERNIALILKDEMNIADSGFVDEKAQRLTAICALASSIAHDIKNPLVALKTFAELFPLKYNDEDFRNTFSKIVLHEVKRIDEMVSRLLDFAHPKKMVIEDVDLEKIIKDTLDLFSLKLNQQKINVKKINMNGFLKIKADSRQLSRVFNNIILNAIEAMPHGGSLTLTSGINSLKDGVMGRDGEYAEISIADSGPGISEKELNKIFDPTFTTKKHGSGLGLSISRKIIEDHNGMIDVKSSPKGTVFTIYLPRKMSDLSVRPIMPQQAGSRMRM